MRADRHQDAHDNADLHDGCFVEAIAEGVLDVYTRQLVCNLCFSLTPSENGFVSNSNFVLTSSIFSNVWKINF